ncbi:MAG: hypothetical protein QGH11_11120 [Pirellulaceae bacterium]|jgi:hypothetical protein|nr:hypothetical protein [Pirellulaceae bacterium]
MEVQDMVVGIVAGLLGCLLITARYMGWTWYRQMRLVRLLEGRLGLAWAGRVTVLVGLLLIVMGILIACGYSLVEGFAGSEAAGP